MRKVVRLIAAIYVSAGIVPASAAPKLDLELEGTTVSGLSSGGYMATQMHLAHSDWIAGAGIIAAGPYYCGQNDIKTALKRCVNKQNGDIPLSVLSNQISQWDKSGKIAATRNLSDDKVWILHGTQDNKVIQPVTRALVEQYRAFIGPTGLAFIDDKPFSHHFPTLSSGTDCDKSAPPFIGNCGYDAAGAMLNHLYDNLAEPASEPSGQLVNIDQGLAGEFADTLGPEGYVYIPRQCQSGQTCKLHISFHGCNQNAQVVGTQYAENTGFNRWADANGIVVLYPQTKSSMLMPLNPQGCWDWWGYTDANYATREGRQIQAISTLVNALAQSSKRS